MIITIQDENDRKRLNILCRLDGIPVNRLDVIYCNAKSNKYYLKGGVPGKNTVWVIPFEDYKEGSNFYTLAFDEVATNTFNLEWVEYIPTRDIPEIDCW